MRESPIGVLGAGIMGSGIAQVAASAGHPVVLCDASSQALAKACEQHRQIHDRLVEKGRLSANQTAEILARIRYEEDPGSLAPCQLVIEAIVEDLDAKRQAFRQLEQTLPPEAVLATNTSSLSITSVAAGCRRPERVLGAHFFNPAPLMALVEIIPGLETSPQIVDVLRQRVDGWGKTTVLANDTPGFIVNRVARPFYGEALRILEEGIADVPTIDWAMREIGGFRMGPFQLMDLIGNDVNLTVSETVFQAFYYDPRYKPSLIQKRLVEAGRLGRKAGRGFYDYAPGAESPTPTQDPRLAETVFQRVLCMLINEAFDAVFLQIATPDDVDLAMTKGVNYPKGLLRWAKEMGYSRVLRLLQDLQEEYGEDRYRPSPLLKRLAREGREL